MHTDSVVLWDKGSFGIIFFSFSAFIMLGWNMQMPDTALGLPLSRREEIMRPEKEGGAQASRQTV